MFFQNISYLISVHALLISFHPYHRSVFTLFVFGCASFIRDQTKMDCFPVDSFNGFLFTYNRLIG